MKRLIVPSLLALTLAAGGAIAQSQDAQPEASQNKPETGQQQPEAMQNKPESSQTQPSASDNQAAAPPDSMDKSADSSNASSSEQTITNADAKKWVGKEVYSSDGEDLGEIAAINEGSDGNVKEFHADIGGFLGLGETRVRVEPSQLKMNGEKLTLSMTGEQAKNLPQVEDKN